MDIAAYRRKVQFYETDQMGIVHHSNYIRWFEEARVDFMEQAGYGYDKLEGTGISFAVLSAQCEYKSMAHFGEQVDIETEIKEISNSRMVIGYRIYDVDSGTLRCTGETGHCFYHNELQKPVALVKYAAPVYALLKKITEEKEAKAE